MGREIRYIKNFNLHLCLIINFQLISLVIVLWYFLYAAEVRKIKDHFIKSMGTWLRDAFCQFPGNSKHSCISHLVPAPVGTNHNFGACYLRLDKNCLTNPLLGNIWSIAFLAILLLKWVGNGFHSPVLVHVLFVCHLTIEVNGHSTGYT